MGRLCFKDCVQIVDFYHALEHAGHVLEAWLGKSRVDPAHRAGLSGRGGHRTVASSNRRLRVGT
jgi:hypothetical protein